MKARGKAERTELPDGRTRYRYADGTTVYRRSDPGRRRYGTRKPEDPRYVLFQGQWLLPLAERLLPDEERTWPATRPYKDCRKAYKRGPNKT